MNRWLQVVTLQTDCVSRQASDAGMTGRIFLNWARLLTLVKIFFTWTYMWLLLIYFLYFLSYRLLDIKYIFSPFPSPCKGLSGRSTIEESIFFILFLLKNIKKCKLIFFFIRQLSKMIHRVSWSRLVQSVLEGLQWVVFFAFIFNWRVIVYELLFMFELFVWFLLAFMKGQGFFKKAGLELLFDVKLYFQ